jgi:hypothetical protein
MSGSSKWNRIYLSLILNIFFSCCNIFSNLHGISLMEIDFLKVFNKLVSLIVQNGSKELA